MASRSKSRLPSQSAMDLNGESSKRRRKASNRDFEAVENDEHRMIQLAIENSKRDTKRVDFKIPDAPVYHPTIEEFKDPIKYITQIQPEAISYGICKIVPPEGWNPPQKIDFTDKRSIPTRLQEIHALQEGNPWDDGEEYTLQNYKLMAEQFSAQWNHTHHQKEKEGSGSGSGSGPSLAQLEKDYWDLVETATPHVEVEYGNDIDTSLYFSGFPNGIRDKSWTGVESEDCDDMFSSNYYHRTGWNLNNIAAVQGSILKFVETPIAGVIIPWLYVGMLFSSFCWHAEDNHFYSINYSHFGASKQWYGIPETAAKYFEQAAKEMLPGNFKENPDLLHHMTTQISPHVLIKRGIPVYRCVQDCKSFIITFPRAFHAGFNYGFNCNEAVNFATADWLPFGAKSDQINRDLYKGSVISHIRLLLTLARHLDTLPRDLIPQLTCQLLEVLRTELKFRTDLESENIRTIPAPPDKFILIDKRASDYDEKRECYVCKHVCVLSALACDCNSTNVTCSRHIDHLCKCPLKKKYLIAWMSVTAVRELIAKAAYLHNVFTCGDLPSPNTKSSPNSSDLGYKLDTNDLVSIANSLF